MKSFFRTLFHRNPPRIPRARISPSRNMSAQTSAILYAATVADLSLSSTRPDDEFTKNKAHHKGNHFDNPWESWR
jgi:hypothetical protein